MKFRCNQCTMQFNYQYELIMHRKSHKSVLKPPAYENKENDHAIRCHMCNLFLINQDHLKNHVAQHVKEQNYVCGQCKKSFKTETRYIHHITDKSVHSNQCCLCSKTLSNKLHLQNHIKLHTRETNFHCATCKKPFYRKDKLDAHEKTHSPEFHCRICEEQFKSKLILSRHNRSVHSSAMFKCSECPKKYIKEGHLKSHSRLHVSNGENYKFQCNQCEKSFRTNGHLVFHKRTHKILF